MTNQKSRGAGVPLAVLMVAAAMLALVPLSGCSDQPEWKIAPAIHHCSDEQVQRVEEEAEWCIENTDYLSTFCYGSAFMRNCPRLSPEGVWGDA